MSLIRNLTVEQIKEIWREYYKTEFSDLNHDVNSIIFNILDRYSQERFKHVNREIYQDEELIVKSQKLKIETTDYFQYIDKPNFRYKDNIVTFKNFKFRCEDLDSLYIFKLNDQFVILSDNKFIYSETKNTNKLKLENFDDEVTNIILIDPYKTIILKTKNLFYLYVNNNLYKTNEFIQYLNLYFIKFRMEFPIVFCIYLNKNGDNNAIMIFNKYRIIINDNYGRFLQDKNITGKKGYSYENMYRTIYDFGMNSSTIKIVPELKQINDFLDERYELEN